MFLCLNCKSIKRHNIWRKIHHFRSRQVGWLVGMLVVLRINVDLAIFQPYLDLEAGDDQSLKIQVSRPGSDSRSSCSASQELNHSATAAPQIQTGNLVLNTYISREEMETFHLYNTNQSKILVCDQNGIYVCLSLAKQQT